MGSVREVGREGSALLIISKLIKAQGTKASLPKMVTSYQPAVGLKARTLGDRGGTGRTSKWKIPTAEVIKYRTGRCVALNMCDFQAKIFHTFKLRFLRV